MTPRQPVTPPFRRAPGANARPMRRCLWISSLGFVAGNVRGPIRPRRCTCATTASAPSRSPTTTRPLRGTVTRAQIAAGPQTIWRYAPLLPGVGPRAHRPRHGLHAPGAGRPPGGRARPRRAVGQERHRQPHRLVQGPGGVGGADQGPPARLQGGRVRLHRQPGQLGGRPRGARRHGVGGVHPPRPRGGQGRDHRRLRRPRGGGGGHLRRRQPAVRRAHERAARRGPS